MVYEGAGNESNVAASAERIGVAASVYADLHVTALSGDGTYRPGQATDLQWTVENSTDAWGDTPVGDWSDRVILSQDDVYGNGDDVVLGTFAHSGPLARGASTQESHRVTLPNGITGAYHLFVVTDHSHQIYEYTFEGNNVFQALAIDVEGSDLVVSEVSVPEGSQFGDTITVSWMADNSGAIAAGQAWSDGIWLSRDTAFGGDDIRLGYTAADAAPLAAGTQYAGSAEVTLPIRDDFESGDYYLIIRVDEFGNQPETDETNNIIVSEAVGISMPPLPDLVVSEIVLPMEALSGQEIPISWTLTNQGDGAASGTWRDYVYFSTDDVAGNDQYLGYFTFTDWVGAGESITRTQTITLDDTIEGDYWLVLETDRNNNIYERGQDGNNTRVSDSPIEITLQPFPNLQVTETTPPAVSFSSQQTMIEWSVTNTGDAGTSAPNWYDRIYLS